MAGISTTSDISADAPASGAVRSQAAVGPFAVVTLLFFFWGFITVMNDVLLPYLKESFVLSYLQAGLIQFAFFSAFFVVSLIYYVLSLRGADPIQHFGYKRLILVALVICTAGCGLFWLASVATSYPFFLGALFLLATGVTLLQISANPYAEAAGVEPADAPTPADIAKIAAGEKPGDEQAARGAFERLGETVGVTIAMATCFLDSLVVIGGGLSGAADLFMPALIEMMSAPLSCRDGSTHPRVPHNVFDLRTDKGRSAYANSEGCTVTVPLSERGVTCHPEPRLGIGVSRLRTNQATAVGAYAFAIQQLDND